MTILDVIKYPLSDPCPTNAEVHALPESIKIKIICFIFPNEGILSITWRGEQLLNHLLETMRWASVYNFSRCDLLHTHKEDLDKLKRLPELLKQWIFELDEI